MELTIEQALQQGVAAHKEGKLQDAERLYRAILQSQPLHPDANHNLGVLAVSVNKADAALPLFKIALEANSKIEQFWFSYIDALIKEKQFDTAREIFEEGKKQGLVGDKLNTLDSQIISKIQTQNVNSANPSQQQLSNLLEYYQNGRYGDAEKIARSITREYPDHQFGWKVLGAILKQTGRVSEALVASQKSVQVAPQDAEAHYNLGNTLKKLGKLKESELSYRQVIALQFDYTEAHNNLGNTLKELGRLDEAEASYTQAIALKFNYAEAHNNLGNTLKELGRLDEAEASYTQAIALKSDYAEAHNNLGNTLKELGRLDEAEASYTQAIALKSEYTEAHYNLGNTLQGLGRLEEAEARYRQAIALTPDFAEAHNNLGATLQKLGRLEEAEASYRRAIELERDYTEAHINLGITLKDLGKFVEAGASYRQAIALKTDYAEARYNLGVLLIESRQYSIAAEQFDLIDFQQSKSLSIKCSYLQGEENNFYDKLEFLINQGELNAVIGSLISCAGIRYGIKKLNPFCNEPLKYVVKTNLNEQYDFQNIFAKTAGDVLTDKSVSYKMQGHLTNGIQTAGNVFAFKRVFITEIESTIRAEIEKYRIKFKDSKEGFIKNWPTFYDISGWLVSMQSGGELAAHMHDAGWITGSIYINVPPKTKPNEGNLGLCMGDQQQVLEADESQKNIIDVVTGDLCLFPSSLHHYTVPFKEEENRIVLAFDVIPKK